MREFLDSIVVTMSQQTIKERAGGYKQICREWIDADGENSTWWYRCGNAPKRPWNIVWVYWVVKGRIRWRSRLLEIQKDKEMLFGGQNTPKYAKAWLVMFDFERIPRTRQIEMKGFQGFRYFNSEKV